MASGARRDARLADRLAALLATAVLLVTATTVGAHPTEFRDIVSRAGPSVVNIEATRSLDTEDLADREEHRGIPDFFDRFFGEGDVPPSFDTQSIGSGFIISEDGLVVTNHHVVDDAKEIRIRLNDRREFLAEIIGSDRATDIALLQIRGRDLPVASIGSSETVEVGDWVVAIGSPFNFENTVTAGILSARGRSFPQQQYVPFLQTDVPINRGNSGGPLLDLGGNVIGVNSQIFSENGTYMGLSFSIPIEIVMSVVAQLREAGAVTRGLLGVGIEDVTRDLATVLDLPEARGAIVTTVNPGSAAHAAGIQPWDVITAVDGRPVTRFSDLPPMIGVLRPGTPARIGVVRDGRRQTIDVVIGSSDIVDPPDGGPDGEPDTTADAIRPARLGLKLAPEAEGLRIEEILWDDAWRAGLRKDDLIQAVDGAPISSLDALDERLTKAVGEPVALLIVRGSGVHTFVVVPAVSP